MKMSVQKIAIIMSFFLLQLSMLDAKHVEHLPMIISGAGGDTLPKEVGITFKPVEKFSNEVRSIKEKHQKGEITTTEMEAAIDAAAEILATEMDSLWYSSNITIKIDDKKEVIITRKTDSNSNIPVPPTPPVVSIEKDEQTGESKVKVKVKGNPKASRRTYWGLTTAFGRGLQYPDNEFWRGGYVDFGLIGNTRLGGARSPIYLNYGVSLVRTTLEIGNNNRLIMVDGAPDFRPIEGAALIRARLSSGHVNGQLGLRIAPGRHKKFHVDIVAYSGVRWRTTQELRFKSDQNERVDERRRSRYGTELFNYGVMANIGYDWISLFARYDLSSMFVVNDVHDIKPFSAGLRFTLM